MSLRDVCFKCLEILEKPVSRMDVTKHIIENDLYDFTNTLRPDASVSAELGNFIRRGDVRVQQTKDKSNVYLYYLSKNETLLIDQLLSLNTNDKNTIELFKEKDLHIILSTFIKSEKIYSKTILHEKNKKNDKNQIWTNPDIVAVKFENYDNTTEHFLKVINIIDLFKLYSYEMKREIKSDNELKEAYFQALSNSSWANYGYLVAFNINTNLYEEIKRLNKSFGIGCIELSSNIYDSKIIAPARLNELDFDTINKLAKNNTDFNEFIKLSRKVLSNTDIEDTEVRLNNLNLFCNTSLENDDIEKYFKDKNIPIEE